MGVLDHFSSLPRSSSGQSREAWSPQTGSPDSQPSSDPIKMESGKLGNGAKEEDAGSGEFVSPIRAMKANFRMNQLFGIFPYSISKDFMTFEFRPLRLIWFFALKFGMIGLILLLLHLRLSSRGFDFTDLWERAFGHGAFSRTDYFAIVSHYLFLQGSASFIFFVNLKLGWDLTKLNAKLKDLTETISEGDIRANPSAFRMMCYRYFVCFLCTVASILYLSGIQRIVKNPGEDGQGALDVLVVAVVALALYIENQNHMFTELVFLRFLNILKHHFNHTLEHLKQDHPMGRGARSCCYSRCKTLYDMFVAINKTFGMDLLITITILVISIAFGIYIFLAFTVFIGDHGDHILFIAAYFMYWAIPSLRLYVIVEGSESIRRGIRRLRYQLDAIQTDILCGDKSARKIQYIREATLGDNDATQAKAMIGLNGDATFDLARLRRVLNLFHEVADGFSASGFFSLNRGILTALIGSLVTYLIVLLQFKVTDLADRDRFKYDQVVAALDNLTVAINEVT